MQLDLTDYQNKLKEELKIRISKLGEKNLWILTDDVDKQCATYMKSKIARGEELKLGAEKVTINSMKELKEVMHRASKYNIATIMQLPIKKEYEDYYNSMRPKTDVDGFFSYQQIAEGDYSVVPATPKACLEYMIDSEGLNLNLRNKSIVIVGRGKLVGYPLAMMCMNDGATVTVINTKTEKSLRESVLRKADIVVLATGHKGSVKIWELSEHKPVYVLNVGTCFDSEGKLTTELEIDYDRDNVFYTPRVKGIGVLTVLNLFDNTVNFYEK